MSDIQGWYQEVAPGYWRQLVELTEAERAYALATESGNQQPDTGANYLESLGAQYGQAGNRIEDPNIKTSYEPLMEGIEPAFAELRQIGIGRPTTGY